MLTILCRRKAVLVLPDAARRTLATTTGPVSRRVKTEGDTAVSARETTLGDFVR